VGEEMCVEVEGRRWEVVELEGRDEGGGSGATQEGGKEQSRGQEENIVTRWSC
jgi:hypothetical protein